MAVAAAFRRPPRLGIRHACRMGQGAMSDPDGGNRGHAFVPGVAAAVLVLLALYIKWWREGRLG